MTALIERWRDRLPVEPDTPVVSLGEGGTPLLQAPRLSSELGVDVRLKWEGANPTGSYKDRGMTLAVSKALGAGAAGVVCASTGNTAASAAAYAARAGLAAVVLHPAGAVAGPKLAQTHALGARVLAIRGTFEDALAGARSLAERGRYVLVNSLNPDRVAGQKTAVFELVEELGGPPVAVYLPYGGGGNTTAYARGFAELDLSCRLVPAEAADRRRTLATAIRIAEPAHSAAVAQLGVEVVSVTDREIVAAWRDLARLEGVFCEPASAAPLAALRRRPPAPGSLVVCVLTGHGLKDVDAVAAHAAPAVEVEADPDALAEAAA